MSSHDLNRKTVIWTITVIAALCLARFVFFYVTFLSDPGLIIDPDSQSYIAVAKTLFESGRFGAYAGDGTIVSEEARG